MKWGKGMEAHRKSMTGVTKTGVNQRLLLQKLRYRALTFSELLRCTGLSSVQVKQALEPLVSAGILSYVWASDGRAVYQLEKEVQ